MAVDSSIPARPAIQATAAPIRLPPRHRRRVLLPLPSSSSNVSSPSPPATAGLPPPPARHRGSLCFHHRQWGPSAQRCRHPCSWWCTPPGCTGRRWIIGHLAAGGDLLHLTDSISGQRFLIDTGSSRSVFPHHSSAPPSGPQLITAGGTPVPTWGVPKLNLSFSPFKFTFPFVLAQVSYPILGADFLAAHHLLVDVAARQVLHKPSHTPLCRPTPSPTATSSSTSILSSLYSLQPQLLGQYPTVFLH